MGRWTARKSVATLAVGGLFAGASFIFGMAGATAAPATHHCGGSVSGKMGETVSLKSVAVKDVVVKAVRGGFDFPLLPLTKSNQTKLREMFDAGKFDPIGLTTVPRAAAGVFSDEKIALAVVRDIEATKEGKHILSKHNNRDAVLKAVEGHCSDLIVRAADYVAPKPPKPAKATKPGAPAAPQGRSSAPSDSANTSSEEAEERRLESGVVPEHQGTGTARAPQRDYGGVPFELPGLEPGEVPDAKPYSTAPGLGDVGVLGSDPTQDPEVSNAGNAEQLQAADGRHRALQLPMLLAVVSLACVAAALVRTWVLRRL